MLRDSVVVNVAETLDLLFFIFFHLFSLLLYFQIIQLDFQNQLLDLLVALTTVLFPYDQVRYFEEREFGWVHDTLSLYCLHEFI